MFHKKITHIQKTIKEKKIVLLLVAAAFIGGMFGSVALFSQQANANILGDIYNGILRGFGVAPQVPSQDQSSQKIVEPYEPLPHSHEDAVVSSVEHATPAVVSIVITKDLPVIEQCPSNPFSNLPPDIQQFFGFGNGNFQFSEPCQKGTQSQEVGGGSGFIVSSDGIIVTNKHVVSDTKATYTVLTNDGKSYEASVLARHPIFDIAILKIQAHQLPTVHLGDSDALRLGQSVIAIGNALGEYRNTVSVGVVSGLARNIVASDSSGSNESIENVIQTDAAINPGNSGGPLLNLRGEVIGINVATVSGAQNIGFAIPINVARTSIESVEKSGEISIPYLGVRYISLNEAVAKQYNLDVTSGALIKGTDNAYAVEPNSPADRAGLKEGDVILEMDGQKVDQTHSLAYLISQHSIGDRVTLKIKRGSDTQELRATLEKRANED